MLALPFHALFPEPQPSTTTHAHPNSCSNFHALAELLHAFHALEHLDLSENDISQHGVQRLAAHLLTATALGSLSLARCVQATYTHSLAVDLGHCSGLTSLRLNYDSIGDFEVIHYARHLQLCRLVLLDLRGNGVATGGAQVALSNHSQPCLLKTYRTRAHSKAQALAASLEFYAALTHLLLPQNHIGFVGAAALLEHSARCSTLTSLDLSSNVLGRMRPARLFPALHSFAARHQHSGSDGFEAIVEVHPGALKVGSSPALPSG